MPRPGSLVTSNLPPSECTWALTASRPTPRPARSVTSPAVEKPARDRTSASEPSCRASSMISGETPRPSSQTVISTRPPRGSARSSMWPHAGLPGPLAFVR